jgi:hypothetical protein
MGRYGRHLVDTDLSLDRYVSRLADVLRE